MHAFRPIKKISIIIFLSFFTNCILNPFRNSNIDLKNDIFVLSYWGNIYGYDWETFSLSSESDIGPHGRKILFSSDGKYIFTSTYCAFDSGSTVPALL